MAASVADPLPIESVLPDLAAALATHPSAVLVAPPGAGKSTRVPLALLDAAWLDGRRILVLEPRRLAARAVASRMAAILGERVGDTVGLRMRMETLVSRRTRIEVVTEGVFVRAILADPSLSGTGAVLFDEFHERSLDADVGLAFALEAQGALREDLRLLVMSATLDDARVSRLLGSAPVIRSDGRAFPVETRYGGRDPGERIEEAVARAILRALAAEPGSCLVFLPGTAEIRRTATLLADRLRDPLVDVVPLHGTLDRAEQDRAIRPAVSGRRKVVLASAIAETSLTIEGVRIVVDSGLARVPVYEPGLGLTRLVTRRVSRAAADQRRGRAGRTAPGTCHRLWEEAANGALEPFGRPEILSADLAPLRLDAAEWGTADPRTLPFLDPPPEPALAEARAMLTGIGALDPEGRLTPEGRTLRSLPLPPRLARMVLAAATHGAATEAARLAALLSERGLGGDAVDLAERLDGFGRDRSKRAEDTRRLAAGWGRQAVASAQKADDGTPPSLGALVGLAYLDRVARARGALGEYVMANGRGARLPPHLALARSRFLAIAEIVGGAASAQIVAAAAIEAIEVEAIAGAELLEATEVTFDAASRSLQARATRRFRALRLAAAPVPVPRTAESAAILARGLAALGVDALPWSAEARRSRERVAFLRAGDPDGWPDLSEATLAHDAEAWLAPHLLGLVSAAAIGPDLLDAALAALLPWDQRERLGREAPASFVAPTGTALPVAYGEEGGPAVFVRVQELFGLDRHPALAGGRVPLALHLLSPAGRPIQVTRDLPGFWRGSWAEVRSAMRGRYPKHPWPEDPLAAAPTSRAKPRGT